MFGFLDRAIDWAKDKVLDKIKKMTMPAALTSAAVGLIGGTFPIPLATTPVTLALSKVAESNPLQYALATAVNLLSMPLQLMALPVFAQLTALVFGQDAAAYTRDQVKTLQTGGIVNFIKSSSKMLALATIGWVFFAVPAMVLVRTVQMYYNKK